MLAKRRERQKAWKYWEKYEKFEGKWCLVGYEKKHDKNCVVVGRPNKPKSTEFFCTGDFDENIFVLKIISTCTILSRFDILYI